MLPDPEFHQLPPKVKEWAQALIAELERYKEISTLFPVEVGQLPPPDRDGLQAFARIAGGGGFPVYSSGGVWRRFATDEVVS